MAANSLNCFVQKDGKDGKNYVITYETEDTSLKKADIISPTWKTDEKGNVLVFKLKDDYHQSGAFPLNVEKVQMTSPVIEKGNVKVTLKFKKDVPDWWEYFNGDKAIESQPQQLSQSPL